MKTRYRLFLVALLYGSYPMSVMFSYCLIGSYPHLLFFLFIAYRQTLSGFSYRTSAGFLESNFQFGIKYCIAIASSRS